MAANKITNTLVANITAQEDSTQNIVINRGTGNPSFDSVLATMSEYIVLPVGTSTINLPVTVCYQLYIRNNDPAAVITPVITPLGLTSRSLTQLYPGDQVIIWQSNAGANAGFTTLQFISNVANALVEYFIGA